MYLNQISICLYTDWECNHGNNRDLFWYLPVKRFQNIRRGSCKTGWGEFVPDGPKGAAFVLTEIVYMSSRSFFLLVLTHGRLKRVTKPGTDSNGFISRYSTYRFWGILTPNLETQSPCQAPAMSLQLSTSESPFLALPVKFEIKSTNMESTSLTSRRRSNTSNPRKKSQKTLHYLPPSPSRSHSIWRSPLRLSFYSIPKSPARHYQSSQETTYTLRDAAMVFPVSQILGFFLSIPAWLGTREGDLLFLLKHFLYSQFFPEESMLTPRF